MENFKLTRYPRSTASSLRITPEIAAFYNYQIHPPSVEAEVNVYAKGGALRRDFTGFRSRKQREEDQLMAITSASNSPRLRAMPPVTNYCQYSQ